MHFLPDEILLLIVQRLVTPYVKSARDIAEYRHIQQTLYALCLTSSRLRSIAQPRLYRTFLKPKVFPDPDPGKEQSRQENGQCSNKERTRLESFIRTLIERPDLATQVECLRIESFSDEDHETIDSSDGSDDDSCEGKHVDSQLPLDPLLAELFVKAIMEVHDPAPTKCGPRGITQWAEWEEYLKQGSEGAQIALLLTLVPSLRYLYLEPNGEDLGLTQDLCDKLLGPDSFEQHSALQWSTSGPSKFLSQRSDPRSILNQLQHLTIRSPLPESAKVRLENCVSLLTLPTLQSFSGYNLEEEEGFDSDEQFYSLPLSHLCELRLEDSFVAGGSIRILSESCTALRSLEIAFPGSVRVDGQRDYDVDLGDEFVESLNARSSSLERLSLIMPRGWSSLTVATPFDIRSLDKLRVLDVHEVISSLANDPPRSSLDNLPRSLELLSIRNCSSSILPFVNTLVAASGEFTRLKAIGIGRNVDSQPWHDEELDDALQNLTILAEAVGIQLKVWVEPKPLDYLQSLLDG